MDFCFVFWHPVFQTQLGRFCCQMFAFSYLFVLRRCWTSGCVDIILKLTFGSWSSCFICFEWIVWFVLSLTHGWTVYFRIVLHCRFQVSLFERHQMTASSTTVVHTYPFAFFNTWPTYLNITTNLLHPTMPAFKAILCTAIFSSSHFSKPFCWILHRFKNAHPL